MQLTIAGNCSSRGFDAFWNQRALHSCTQPPPPHTRLEIKNCCCLLERLYLHSFQLSMSSVVGMGILFKFRYPDKYVCSGALCDPLPPPPHPHNFLFCLMQPGLFTNLTMQMRITLRPLILMSLSLPSAGITAVHYYMGFTRTSLMLGSPFPN